MKYITFTIPCYNSENYMRRCVDSLLVGGEDVEILIIDDGSSDRTGAIADEYEMLYPNIVKAVHKPNGGHGSGVNKGLELAHGLYYKVVDSDDWFDRDAYLKMLDKIKSFEVAQFPDLIICNYVYDHLDEGIQKPMNYRNVFPTEKMCNWNTIGHFHPSQYLIMHALMFQTKVLRQSGVKLPEHTFYVDNLFSYQPLPYAKNLVDLREVKKMYPKLAVYMMRNISIMLSISSIHLLLIKTEEAFQKRKRMWEQVKDYDRILYYRLRCSTLSGLTYLPGRLGGKITVGGYRMARKIYQFQ